jgi:hypothetical protein
MAPSKGKKRLGQQESPAKADFLRRFRERPFVFAGTIVILVIVIVAFVFVPAIVPSADSSGADLNFGFYDKIPITFVPGNYFSKMRETVALEREAAGNVNDDSAVYSIWRQAFERTVVRIGILQELKNAGYTPPAEAVDQRLIQEPQFQENGRFSLERYQRLDRLSRLTLRREIQDTIAEEQYLSDLLGLRSSSKEAAFIGAMASPERSFNAAAFALNSYPVSEIAAYVTGNPDLFRVTRLSMISVNSGEREARQVFESVREGNITFEDAARTQSRDRYADSGGDLGVKLAFELAREIPDAAERAAVLSLKKGEFSSVVRVSNDGWGFFRCEDDPYLMDTGDTASLEKVRDYLKEFERGRIDDWLINEAEGFIAAVNEAGFDSALLLKGLENRSFGPIPINYGGNALFYTRYYNLFTALASFSVPELAGADTDENFWRTAFSTPLNTPSRPMVVGDYILVLYPVEERPADETKIEEIESVYSSYWLSHYAEQGLYSHFVTSKKLEDRFMEMFFRYLWSPGNGQ